MLESDSYFVLPGPFCAGQLIAETKAAVVFFIYGLTGYTVNTVRLDT